MFTMLDYSNIITYVDIDIDIDMYIYIYIYSRTIHFCEVIYEMFYILNCGFEIK